MDAATALTIASRTVTLPFLRRPLFFRGTTPFAAGRLANPFWRIYDLVLLGLVVSHGVNGARIVIDDYVQSRGWRALLKTALWTIGVLFLVVGAFVLFTFQPVTG